MRRKINPFVLLILIVALGAALHQGGVLDLFSKYDSASDVNEKENASEVGTSDVPETKEIDANHVHKVSMTKKLNKVAATCQKKGGYEKVKYCSCGVEMSRQDVCLKLRKQEYRRDKKTVLSS